MAIDNDDWSISNCFKKILRIMDVNIVIVSKLDIAYRSWNAGFDVIPGEHK